MCYEIPCKKFLRDYISSRNSNGRIEIRDLNKAIANVRKAISTMLFIDFTQSALSSLINASNGNLVWENGCIRYEKGFLDVMGKETFDELPDDLEKKYLDVIKAC